MNPHLLLFSQFNGQLILLPLFYIHVNRDFTFCVNRVLVCSLFFFCEDICTRLTKPKVSPSPKQVNNSISLPDEMKNYVNPRQVLLSLLNVLLEDAQSDEHSKRTYVEHNR